MGKNIGYIRVSTIDQNDERQLSDVELDKVFQDKASARSTDRPELKEMMDFIRTGDTLHVHSMDRLARNLYDLLNIVNKLTDSGVAVTFHKENLTFTGEADSLSKLMLSIMGAFAEFERSLLRERQREGIQIAKDKGRYKGRPRTITDEQIIEIKQKVADRYKVTDIAREYGISRHSIYKFLRAEREAKR